MCNMSNETLTTKAHEMHAEQRTTVRTTHILHYQSGKHLDNDQFYPTSTGSDDIYDGLPLEPARSRQRVDATRHLSSVRTPAQREPDLDYPPQRASDSGDEHHGERTNVNDTKPTIFRSNELHYALAKQLCLLQSKVYNLYK